jgi:cyanophycinase
METNIPSECPVPAGKLLIIGGSENKGEMPEDELHRHNFERLEILKAFVNLIGKKDPVVEVITSASGKGGETYSEYKDLFKELKVKKVGHMHHEIRKEALDETVLERIKNADGFFFSGGDQLQLTSLYGGTEFLQELKKRYIRENIVIAGTSAGAMALSTPMIYAGNDEIQQIGGEIRITTGLEFLKDVCIDTHFVHRSRFVRMAQVIATNPTCIGIGIEEDTAIIVTEGVHAEVIGAGVIIYIDGMSIERSNISDFDKKIPVSIRELKVHILNRGDKFTIPQVNPPHK